MTVCASLQAGVSTSAYFPPALLRGAAWPWPAPASARERQLSPGALASPGRARTAGVRRQSGPLCAQAVPAAGRRGAVSHALGAARCALGKRTESVGVSPSGSLVRHSGHGMPASVWTRHSTKHSRWKLRRDDASGQLCSPKRKTHARCARAGAGRTCGCRPSRTARAGDCCSAARCVRAAGQCACPTAGATERGGGRERGQRTCRGPGVAREIGTRHRQPRPASPDTP